MRVTELTYAERGLWDAFVQAAPHGLPQHLSGWQDVLANTYGYDTCYLVAWHEANGHGPTIAGVMPLFLVKSPIFGRTAMTMPGGLCAEDESAATALLEQARAVAHRAHAKRLVLHDTRQAWPGEWTTTCDHENWLVDLRPGHEAVWQRLDRNIRRQVRMAKRNGLTHVVDRSGAKIGEFYQVLSRFTHQVGTPVFGCRFLENTVAAFPGGFNIVMVYHENQPIGGYFQLEMAQAHYGVWGATLHEYLELRPVYLAYWEIIADTMAQGRDWLDMGRSPAGSSISKYKGQWAQHAIPVYQQVMGLRAGAATSVAHQASSDARFRSVRQLWPRLPFAVAQFLGPRLRRYVPFA